MTVDSPQHIIYAAYLNLCTSLTAFFSF